jgi:hypothetical protein
LPLIPLGATVRFLDRTPTRTGILASDTVLRYVRLLAIPLLPILLAACQLGTPVNRATPSVSQIGSDLKCHSGDHAFEDNVAGWGFCYPGTWKYNLRAQSQADPPELDLVFDITNVPCVIPSAAKGESPRPVCSGADAGLFGLMIVTTYQRGGASSLSDWTHSNPRVASSARLSPTSSGEPISWGNAQEALKLGDGRRIALTKNHVVVLELRSGAGNLDLEGAMAQRLDTWKFFT